MKSVLLYSVKTLTSSSILVGEQKIIQFVIFLDVFLFGYGEKND